MLRVYADRGCYDTLANAAKVEGIVPRAAWHWGRDSTVVNDPLGEPGRTPLYVGLLSTWGSVDGDQMFSPHFKGGLLSGDSYRYKQTSKPLALETAPLSSHGGTWRRLPYQGL